MTGNIDNDPNDEIVFFNKTNTGGIVRAIDPLTGVNDGYLYYNPGFDDFIDTADKAFLGDINGNNRKEMILLNYSSYTGAAVMVINVISGEVIRLIYHGEFLNLMDTGDEAFVEDVNGNGTDDLILINRSGQGVFLKVIDLASGMIIKTINYSDLYPGLEGWIDEQDRIFVGKVDGNNLLDLVMLNTSYFSGAIRVLEIMTEVTIKIINHGPFTGMMDATDRIFLGDINCNNKDDLVFVNTDYTGIAITAFDITGDSIISEISSVGFAEWMDVCDRIFLGDVNNDGKQDLMFVNISKDTEAIRVVNLETGYNLSFIRNRDLAAGAWFDYGNIILTGEFNGNNNLVLINTDLTADFIRIIDVIENTDVARISYSQIYPLMNGWFDGYTENHLNCLPAYPTGVMIYDKEHVCNGAYIREIRPRNYQLYPRNENNTSTVKISGHLAGHGCLTMKIIKTSLDHSQVINYVTVEIDSKGHFYFSFDIPAELSEYSFYYSSNLTIWTAIAENVVCGDAFIISGQSNAAAGTDPSGDSIMNLKYGYNGNNIYGKYSRTCRRWGVNPNASWCYPEVSGGCGVGIWGLKLQYELQKINRVPTCLINDAESGTSMKQHHIFDEDPFYHIFSPLGKYLMGSMLTRTYYAELRDNIKAIMWFNGEHEVGSENPVQGIYADDFNVLYNSCKSFLGSYQKMYVVQVSSFISDLIGSGIVSEEQRQLPANYNDLQVMASNGIGDKNPMPGQHIHFIAESYEELGRRMYNMIEEDIYNNPVANNCRPPDISKAGYISNKIFLHFNQPLDSSKSDPIENIISVIRFNIPGISIFNAGFSDSCIYFEVDPQVPLSGQTISYAGFLPGLEYNLKCYIRNSDNVAALSFNNVELLPETGPVAISSGYDLLSDGVQVFPNPVRAKLNIYTPASSLPNTIQIINSMGIILYQENSSSGETSIDCSGFPMGFYFLRILNSSKVTEKKFVIAG